MKQLTLQIITSLFIGFAFLNSVQASEKEILLALNWKAEPQFGGFYAAEVHGIFARYGLKVKIIEGGSGSPTIQMLGSKQVDFAVVSADEILLSLNQGNKEPRAVFATYQVNPQSIMIHKDTGVKNIAELILKKEMTLLWQEGLPYAQFLKSKYGKNFAIQTAPYSGGIGLFQNNKSYAQQCFETSEPLLARKNGLKVQTFLVSESGYNPYTTVLATTSDLISKDPKLVQNMRRAVQEGWAQYLKDPEKTNQFMGKLNKSMDLETLRASAAAQVSLIQTAESQKLGLGVMTDKRWADLTEQLFELKLIKTKPRPSELYLF